MGSRFGVSTEKIEALGDHAKSSLFSEAEKVALEYADAHLLSAGLVAFSFLVLLMPGRYSGQWQRTPI